MNKKSVLKVMKESFHGQYDIMSNEIHRRIEDSYLTTLRSWCTWKLDLMWNNSLSKAGASNHWKAILLYYRLKNNQKVSNESYLEE